MRDQLASHVRVLFKFYRRSRLLIAIGCVYLGWVAFSLVSATAMRSGGGRFELVRWIFEQLNGFAHVLSAALALLVVSSHLRNKSLKVVFTKPCPPESWLASCVLTSAALSLAVHAMTLGLALALSLIWSIPLQVGFVVLSIHGFVSALVLVAYVTFLAMAVHPAIAVLLALLLQEQTFYWLRFTLAARIAGEWSTFYWLLERLRYGIYMLLPSYEPYAHRLAGVSRTLRASPADWAVLLYSAAYAVACVLFFYSLAAWLLRRRDPS